MYVCASMYLNVGGVYDCMCVCMNVYSSVKVDVSVFECVWIMCE